MYVSVSRDISCSWVWLARVLGVVFLYWAIWAALVEPISPAHALIMATSIRWCFSLPDLEGLFTRVLLFGPRLRWHTGFTLAVWADVMLNRSCSWAQLTGGRFVLLCLRDLKLLRVWFWVCDISCLCFHRIVISIGLNYNTRYLWSVPSPYAQRAIACKRWFIGCASALYAWWIIYLTFSDGWLVFAHSTLIIDFSL